MPTAAQRARKVPFVPASDPLQLASVGAKVSGIGVRQKFTMAPIQKIELELVNLVITMVDAGAAGSQGGRKIFDFVAGAFQLLGAQCDLTTLAGAGGIADTGALVGSLGSVVVAVDNATLTTTEADIIPSIAGTLVGGAGTLKGNSAAPGAPFNGTTTPLDVFLNLAVPDAGSSADDTVTVNGTIRLYVLPLGDF